MSIKETILNKQLPIQYRFFNLITILYAMVGVIGFTICSIFAVEQGITGGMLVFSLICLIFCALAKATERYELCAAIFYILINMFLMPLAYIDMGGFEVGAELWLVAGIIFGVLTVSRKTMYILLGLNAVILAGLFVVVYNHPEIVRPIKDGQAALIIIAVGVVLASIGVGLMLLYQRREYETQLRLNEIKEKELERLIEELQKSKRHAGQINAAKTGFLKSMSEGIHAPLATILEQGDKVAGAEGTEIVTAGKVVASVIANIVDLSMIESGDFSLKEEAYSLKDELAEIYNITKVGTDKKELRLVFDVNKKLPNNLIGDRGRIGQIILNLLANATQYTSVGEVRLSIEQESATDKTIRLRIKVSDTGIGIRKEDLDSIFYRFNSEERDLHTGFEGVGLGLTVTNQILQLMGSKLEVESEYGQGTTFSFSIVQRIDDWKKVGGSQQDTEAEKDNYAELLALDVKKIKEDMEGAKEHE